MEAPKINASTAVNIAVGLVVIYVAYRIIKAVDFGFDRTGAMLNQAAENYGAASASAANDPRTRYNAARSAYANKIGWPTTDILNLPGWPSYVDWVEGAGPDGYTYGSAKYPKVEDASLWGAITSVF